MVAPFSPNAPPNWFNTPQATPPSVAPMGLSDVMAHYVTQPISNAIQHATGWTPGTTPSWMPQWATDLSNANKAAEQQHYQWAAQHGMSPQDLDMLTGFASPGIIAGEKALLGPMEGGPGWYTGIEGKPKFEISDYGSSVNMDPLRAAREDNIQSYLKNVPRNKEGGLPADARAKAENYVDNHITSTARLGDVLDHPRLYQQYPVLAQRPVTLKNMGLSSGGTTLSGRILLHTNLLDNPAEAHTTLLHELQHIVQDKEGFAPGTNPTATGPAMADIVNERLATAGDASRPFKERQQAADDATRLTAFMSNKNAAYTAYKNTAGEVEARNVEARFQKQQKLVGEAQGDLFRDKPSWLKNRWARARQFEQGMPLGKYLPIERTEDVRPARQILWPGDEAQPESWSAPYGLARAGLLSGGQ